MTRRHSLVARARLLQGLRGEGEQGLSAADWEEVLGLAQKHGVAPLLHRSLEATYVDLQVPGSIQSRLRDAHRTIGIRNTRLVAHLHGILKAFREAGIDVLVLKGAHLAELVYAEVALRPMADVDLLVRSPDVRAATRLLRELGYAGAGGGAELHHQDPIDENMHVEPMRKAGGLLIEIHYALLAPVLMRDPDIEGLWSRARPGRIGGAEAMVLSPEDLLLHLCLHAALNHGFEVSLLHLCDIPEVVDRFRDQLDWAVFWDRAGSWGGERSARVTLELTERLLGWRRPAGAVPAGPPPPAAFDVVALAERLVFEEEPGFARSAHLPKLWGRSRPGEKAGLVLRRAFPSRAEMGFTFGVPASSWKIPFLYPVRVGRLLARYAGPVVGAVRGGKSAAALEVAKERSRIVEWLGSH